MKTFKQFLKEEKQSLNEAWLPKETVLFLSLNGTGYSYLDKNHEQSYFEVSSDMIKAMIKAVKSQSDRDWADAMDVSEEEAREDKKFIFRVLDDWLKSKLQEEILLQSIVSIATMEKDTHFDHEGFVKDLKMYLKNFGK